MPSNKRIESFFSIQLFFFIQFFFFLNLNVIFMHKGGRQKINVTLGSGGRSFGCLVVTWESQNQFMSLSFLLNNKDVLCLSLFFEQLKCAFLSLFAEQQKLCLTTQQMKCVSCCSYEKETPLFVAWLGGGSVVVSLVCQKKEEEWRNSDVTGVQSQVNHTKDSKNGTWCRLA